ncbi:MAG: TetR/AcrR family transcriptional regulator [Bacteroidota bacterium]
MQKVSIVLPRIMDHLGKVLSVSAELFRQYGFKTITMDDIARKAGISKKTLYQHFATKQEVVNEAVLWYKRQMFESTQQLVEGSENSIEAMVRIMQMVEEMCKRINPLSMLELQRYFPEGYKIFREEIIAQDVEMLRNNILSGIEEGLYRPDINAELMAIYHMETALLVFQSSTLVNDRYDLQYVKRELTEHFMYGIMTPKGEKMYRKYKETYLKQVSKI